MNSSKLTSRALFIFHRDLRIFDNHGFNQAMLNSQQVLPCFIFDPVQCGPQNTFRGDHSIQFLLESLKDLNLQLEKHQGKLHVYFDDTISLIGKLIEQHQITSIYSNRDYTPFSRKRDSLIDFECKQRKAKSYQLDDSLLTTPEQVLKSDGTPYSIFTPFYKAALKKPVERTVDIWGGDPEAEIAELFVDQTGCCSLEEVERKILGSPNENMCVNGGREQGLKLLERALRLQDYGNNRNYPSLPQTSMLAAHNKFGTVSVREVFHTLAKKFGKDSAILRELYFRDFWTHVAFYNPHVFQGPYQKKYQKLKWNTDEDSFAKWCAGKTGFPIVDAGMRELLATGHMHGRVRMIVASFLTKDLHFDWRKGERYFATKLIDYDPCVNNGNWQWVASTGGDCQPYFRIFNPWLQQKKFDPDCEYIKKWIPELRKLSPETIHKWNEKCTNFKVTQSEDLSSGLSSAFSQRSNRVSYPAPMVDHGVEKEEALTRYQECNRAS